MKLAWLVLVSTVAHADPAADNEAAYRASLAKHKLAVIALQQELREQVVAMDAPAQTAGHIDLLVSAGWQSDTPVFVANAKHELFLVQRAPVVAKKLTVQVPCPTMRFAGGRAWFEHVRFAIPAGYTYKGNAKIEYPITQVESVEPKGCPEVPWAMD